VDRNGRHYFVDHQNKATCWAHPTKCTVNECLENSAEVFALENALSDLKGKVCATARLHSCSEEPLEVHARVYGSSQMPFSVHPDDDVHLATAYQLNLMSSEKVVAVIFGGEQIGPGDTFRDWGMENGSVVSVSVAPIHQNTLTQVEEFADLTVDEIANIQKKLGETVLQLQEEVQVLELELQGLQLRSEDQALIGGLSGPNAQ